MENDELDDFDKILLLEQLKERIEYGNSAGMCIFINSFSYNEQDYLRKLLTRKAKENKTAYFYRVNNSMHDEFIRRKYDYKDTGLNGFLWKPYNKTARIKWIDSEIAKLNPDFDI